MSLASRSGRQSQGIWTGAVSIDPGSCPSVSSLETAVTLLGVTGDDVVILTLPAGLDDDLIFKGVRVSADDQITMTLYNPTAGAIDDGSLSWPFAVIKAG